MMMMIRQGNCVCCNSHMDKWIGEGAKSSTEDRDLDDDDKLDGESSASVMKYWSTLETQVNQ